MEIIVRSNCEMLMFLMGPETGFWFQFMCHKNEKLKKSAILNLRKIYTSYSCIIVFWVVFFFTVVKWS